MLRFPFVSRMLAVGLLLLAALFPVGMMPGMGQDGQVVMVLCSGNGPVQMVLDPMTGAFHKAPAQGGPACDWAGAQAALDVAPPVVVPVAVVVRRAGPDLAVALWRPAYDPRGLWARGPPVSI